MSATLSTLCAKCGTLIPSGDVVVARKCVACATEEVRERVAASAERERAAESRAADSRLNAAVFAATQRERRAVIEYIELEARRIAKGGTLMDQRSAELFSALAVLVREGAHTKEGG